MIALVAQENKQGDRVDLGRERQDRRNYLSNILDKLQFSRRSQAAAFLSSILCARA